MSIKTNFFDGNSVAAADLIAPWAAMLANGVFGATDFAASAENPADLAVSVAIGRAVKDGHFIRSDAAEKVPISANTSGYNRIDVVALQVDDTNKATTLTVVQGTPSSSPTVPILQSNQLPLAQVSVGNNVSVIDSSAITDIRALTSVKPPNVAALPIGYIFEWSPVSGGPDLSTAQKVHDYFGFGTWNSIGKGRVMVGVDTDDSDFSTAGTAGGEKTHFHTLPIFTNYSKSWDFGLWQALDSINATDPSGDAVEATVPASSPNHLVITASEQPGGFSGLLYNSYKASSMPPYVVCYRWQRIA
jgi:hypothetical protein